MQEELRRYNDAAQAPNSLPPPWGNDIERMRRFRDWQALNLRAKVREVEELLAVHGLVREAVDRVTFALVCQDDSGVRVHASAILLSLAGRPIVVTARAPLFARNREDARPLALSGAARAVGIPIAGWEVLSDGEREDIALLVPHRQGEEALATAVENGLDIGSLALFGRRIPQGGYGIRTVFDEMTMRAKNVVGALHLFFNTNPHPAAAGDSRFERRAYLAFDWPQQLPGSSAKGSGVWFLAGDRADEPRLAGVIVNADPATGTATATRANEILSLLASNFRPELERDLHKLPEPIAQQLMRQWRSRP